MSPTRVISCGQLLFSFMLINVTAIITTVTDWTTVQISPLFPGLNNMSNIISPASLLLSATGTLAFKNCGLSDEVSTFTAPEMLQGRASSSGPATERVCASIFKADLST